MSLQSLLPSILAGALLLLAGCSNSDERAFRAVMEPMRAAETLDFLTIDPQNPRVLDATEALDTAEGHQILGRATLNRERFGVILDGLEAMVASGDSRNTKGCFNPGYALGEASSGGATILICLECSRVSFVREGSGGWATLDQSAAPDLDAHLAGLVKEFGMRTYLDPAP